MKTKRLIAVITDKQTIFDDWVKNKGNNDEHYILINDENKDGEGISFGSVFHQVVKINGSKNVSKKTIQETQQRCKNSHYTEKDMDNSYDKGILDGKTRSITFDKDAQDKLPQSVKDKMKRDREIAEATMQSKKKERKNLYNCKTCGNTITTIDKDKGVTPMMLSCSAFNGCSDGMMFSFMYNVPPIIVAKYEWVKEPGEEVLNIQPIKL